MAYAHHSKRTLALLTLERLDKIMTDITELTAKVASLQQTLTGIAPVLQANADLSTRIIGVLEDVLTQVKNTGPSQADIDALTGGVTASLTQLGADLAEVNATNAALQAEIAKATAPPATAPAA